MEDFKQLMEDYFLDYASYVVCDRAIPAMDGLKPVLRRILHTLYQMHDGKMHKVANVAGQTMAYHPHGDAAIVDALVSLANKGFLLDTQGNFGNPTTGDSHAAARYIETRLSPLACETLFNPEITDFIPSYDGRHSEPVLLPVKLPLLLIQGAEGIAVGMSTRIFPHNFCEVLQAQIAYLQGEPFQLFPDFPTGGCVDTSDYEKGRGKLRVRAKIDLKDSKTLIIREIAYGTTTESLVRSIDDAAKKGNIKIDSISDYTAENVEIEIKLGRGQHADELLEALYAYTECEVTLHGQFLVIDGNTPWEGDAELLLIKLTDTLCTILNKELLLELGKLQEKVFHKTLERVFIENRLYKPLEELSDQDLLYPTLENSVEPYLDQLDKQPVKADYDLLLAIPIRRITRFDIDKNREEIARLNKRIKQIHKELKEIPAVTIRFLEELLKKYGPLYPRRTALAMLKPIDRRAVTARELKVGVDLSSGFVGTAINTGEVIQCTNFDKILLLFDDGSYNVINIPEKQYACKEKQHLLLAMVADKKTVLTACYQDEKSGLPFCKRFVVDKFILDKQYRYLPEKSKLLYFTVEPAQQLLLHFVPKPRQRHAHMLYSITDCPIKGVSAHGIRLGLRPIHSIEPYNKTLSS